MTNETKIKVIAGIALLAVIISLFAGPVPQNPEYHKFADQRAILSVPNFWNVITNVPFLIAGMMGMILTGSGKAPGGLPELKHIYFLFFLGVFATGLGSAYYHLNPINETLVWDRIPIAVSFMAFFCVIAGENISTALARKLVWPLIVLGIFSVFYWYITEKLGSGDLRLYGLVQFLPILLVPVILLLFKPRLTPVAYIWAVLAAYLIAKIAESLDRPIYEAGQIMSGHSLKHLVAAFGTFMFYIGLRRRKVAS